MITTTRRHRELARQVHTIGAYTPHPESDTAKWLATGDDAFLHESLKRIGRIAQAIAEAEARGAAALLEQVSRLSTEAKEREPDLQLAADVRTLNEWARRNDDRYWRLEWWTDELCCDLREHADDGSGTEFWSTTPEAAIHAAAEAVRKGEV